MIPHLQIRMHCHSDSRAVLSLGEGNVAAPVGVLFGRTQQSGRIPAALLNRPQPRRNAHLPHLRHLQVSLSDGLL